MDSKLRGCDLVPLRVRDVYPGSGVSSRTIVMQRKTHRSVQFEITEATREAVAAGVARSQLRSTSYLFPGRSKEDHLSVRQYSRIVKGWARCIGLDQSRYGTHSLRRTKATLIYKRTKNIRAIQLLLGHTKLESTVGIWGSRWTTHLSSRSRRRSNPLSPEAEIARDDTSATVIRLHQGQPSAATEC